MPKKKVVILMSRLSDYMLHCFEQWVLKFGVELFVFRTSVDLSDAPFRFDEGQENINYFNLDEFSKGELEEAVSDIDPNLIICFGWSNKRYLNVVKQRANGIPAVMTMDNQWVGSIRQFFGLVYGRIFLRRLFNYVWVPGPPQRKFANLLGFKKNLVLDGLYVANKENFEHVRPGGEDTIGKKLFFLGRYIEFKGVRELWQAFCEFDDEEKNDWELVCIGTGPLFDTRPKHPKIRHLGFVQPSDLSQHLVGGGVFILPSHQEPWGVVVHEFALAGFPLLVSSAVGARHSFVDDENGAVFRPRNVEAIKEMLRWLNGLSQEELRKMSRSSREKGLAVNVDNWCGTANRFLTGV